MKILAVDCSAGPASSAVVEDGRVIASSYINVKLTHSQTLLSMIKQILESAKLSLKDIDSFAINYGPGSFTGIRIGISAIKGLAAPENKPCFQVSTLESIAENFRTFDCTVCAVMDARCNQVYNAIFKIQNGEVTRVTEDRAVLVSEVQKELEAIEGKIVIAGDGAKLFEAFAEENNQVTIAKEPLTFQNAVGTALVAEKLCQTSKGISHLELKPLYLRLPQAERELKEKKK
ncbi:MAG: tRNA (adenosine(37)-N6)-threonylcarbamoyltransferase complex dimerization subunit type 1 TsaB [Clostridia bacterium]|nr:tRNA (adenosine(37)-N6)-threonylcarbamoyltransferase complex dimerization subunit type 1 TsaB [Clostridia bacterium]